MKTQKSPLSLSVLNTILLSGITPENNFERQKTRFNWVFMLSGEIKNQKKIVRSEKFTEHQ